MLNWSDKLLDRVETALDRSGWLGKTADAVLDRLLPHDAASACIPCHCDDCHNHVGLWCLDSADRCTIHHPTTPCPPNTPC
jgi:hypothetical protein